jgi:hypothetical protein
MTFGLHGSTTVLFAVLLREWGGKLHCRVGKSYYFHLRDKMTSIIKYLMMMLATPTRLKHTFAIWCLRPKKTDIWCCFICMILKVVVSFRSDAVQSGKYLRTFRRNLLRLFSMYKTEKQGQQIPAICRRYLSNYTVPRTGWTSICFVVHVLFKLSLRKSTYVLDKTWRLYFADAAFAQPQIFVSSFYPHMAEVRDLNMAHGIFTLSLLLCWI